LYNLLPAYLPLSSHQDIAIILCCGNDSGSLGGYSTRMSIVNIGAGVDITVIVSGGSSPSLVRLIDLGQHARPRDPQLARNHRLLPIGAIVVAVLTRAPRRAFPVQRPVRAAHEPFGMSDEFERRGEARDVYCACTRPTKYVNVSKKREKGKGGECTVEVEIAPQYGGLYPAWGFV
jgi:hypothetical protein